MGRVYLDHASSSPVRPAAVEAMLPFLREHAADPGRVHSDGRVTRVAIEQAREQVAALFGARPREVVFTSSGTEAVNAAIFGALGRAADHGRAHVVTSAVEHSAVREACARTGGDVTVVPVDGQGRYDPAEVLAALRPDTALVALQHANHEVATRQPVDAVVSAAHAGGALVFVDGCASAGHVPFDFGALGADLAAVTGHKWGAPKGAAAMLVRRGLRVPPFIVGGEQERARRGGIEDVPAIVGFGAAAAELTAGNRLAAEAARATTLTDRLAAAALAVPGIARFGDPDDRLPHVVCIGIAGVEAEPVLLALDQRGIAVHSGSSCSSETLEPSPVLTAMGVDAEHSLRASTGWCTTDDDVEAFCSAFPSVVHALRELRAG